MERITRRTLLAATAFATGAFRPLLRAENPSTDPWSTAELMQPATLAGILTASNHAAVPTIISVAFPFLYRQRHIPNARFAGPASKPEGLAALKAAVSPLSKNESIVLYCGCCPMTRCPNIRPAYQSLKDLGYRNIHVLNLPTNFHTDWTAHGYPVEPSAAHAL